MKKITMRNSLVRYQPTAGWTFSGSRPTGPPGGKHTVRESEQVEEDDDFIFPEGVQLSDWRNVKESQRPLDCSICIAKERKIITQRNYSKVLEEESQVKKRMKS
ncbi:hypothetical protein RUM43_008656 [Polyplax serrata]|uniref:Uncharacterized protein n=1 Tax=Polyplax serrata TaxID=468196 RepID=A0AAN8P9M6_POLSC